MVFIFLTILFFILILNPRSSFFSIAFHIIITFIRPQLICVELFGLLVDWQLWGNVFLEVNVFMSFFHIFFSNRQHELAISLEISHRYARRRIVSVLKDSFFSIQNNKGLNFFHFFIFVWVLEYFAKLSSAKKVIWDQNVWSY